MESGRGSGDRSQLIIRARVARRGGRGVQRGRPCGTVAPAHSAGFCAPPTLTPPPGGRHSGDAGGDRLAPTPVQHVVYPHGRGPAWGGSARLPGAQAPLPPTRVAWYRPRPPAGREAAPP
jgi:hypothetical protein